MILINKKTGEVKNNQSNLFGEPKKDYLKIHDGASISLIKRKIKDAGLSKFEQKILAGVK